MKKTLSEFESKKLLFSYDIQTVPEILACTQTEAVEAAGRIGYPVVLKACSPEIAHKTERNLVVLSVTDASQLEKEYENLVERAGSQLDGILVQKMISGKRELVAGLVRDSTFGPCVMFGLGGIYTEALKDITFRVAPLKKRDALEMIGEIRAQAVLGHFRGMPPVNINILCNILIAVGRIGLERPEISEIDINPLIITDSGDPLTVDALVALEK